LPRSLTAPFAFLSGGYHLEAGEPECQHVASRNGTVSTGVARGSEVAYRRNIREFEWSSRSR